MSGVVVVAAGSAAEMPAKSMIAIVESFMVFVVGYCWTVSVEESVTTSRVHSGRSNLKGESIVWMSSRDAESDDMIQGETSLLLIALLTERIHALIRPPTTFYARARLEQQLVHEAQSIIALKSGP